MLSSHDIGMRVEVRSFIVCVHIIYESEDNTKDKKYFTVSLV